MASGAASITICLLVSSFHLVLLFCSSLAVFFPPSVSFSLTPVSFLSVFPIRLFPLLGFFFHSPSSFIPLFFLFRLLSTFSSLSFLPIFSKPFHSYLFLLFFLSSLLTAFIFLFVLLFLFLSLPSSSSFSLITQRVQSRPLVPFLRTFTTPQLAYIGADATLKISAPPPLPPSFTTTVTILCSL